MKSNSQITIGIFAVILIFWISFLFIEKTDNSIDNSIDNNKIQTTVTQKINTEKKQTQQQIKEQQTKKDSKKEEKIQLEKKLEKEAKEITKTRKQTQIEKNTALIIPQKYDIQNMKFFSQAPYGNRNQPYQDACEEASLLIGYYYIKNLTKTKAEYNTDLLAMVDLEMEMLGYFESTTIMEMKQIINRRNPSINAKIIEHPTIRDIEKEISQNHAVIAPFYGKGINNPHYALGGPDYHFMVIKGYDKDNFITHDVGTIRGANRKYPKSLIMKHMHDRNRVDVQKGAARILILEK